MSVATQAELQVGDDVRLVEGGVVEFAAKAESGGPRRFKMNAYTGAPVRTWWGDQMIVDLKGLSVGRTKKPILRDHDTGRIAGFSESVENDGKALSIAGVLSSSTDDGTEIAQTSDEGFPWQASIGFSVLRVEEIQAGDSKEINGREFNGPGMVVTKSKLKEASFVPLGADDATSTQVFASPGATPVPFTREIQMDKDEKGAGGTAKVDPVQLETARAEALAAGQKAERDRFAALTAAFPDRAAFVADQFGRGATVDQAKVALSDIVLAENKALQTQLADLQAKAMKTDGHPGVGFSGSTAGAPKTSTMTLADQTQSDWHNNKEQCNQEYLCFEDYAAHMRHIAKVGLKTPAQSKLLADIKGGKR